jgi:transposase-like protein
MRNASAGSPVQVDPEVVARPRRRKFTAEYKRKILAEADAAAGTGEIASLLRREGLYSSTLSNWRRERRQPFTGRFPASVDLSPSTIH